MLSVFTEVCHEDLQGCILFSRLSRVHANTVIWRTVNQHLLLSISNEWAYTNVHVCQLAKQKILELPTLHISIQNRKLSRPFNCAWEIIMENETEKPQTFLCQGNLATCFAPGKLHSDTQIGTVSLPEEKKGPKGPGTTEGTVPHTKSSQRLPVISRPHLSQY